MKEEKTWGITLLVLGIGFIAMVLVTNIVPSGLRDQQKANAATLNDLEADLAQYEEGDTADPAEGAPTTEEEEAILNSAAEVGNQVAEYQNAYASLDAREDREAYEANVEAMGALLSESAQDARVRWYTSETPGTWRFITNGEFSGDTLGVLWLCENPDDGSLVAYATGTYESESNTFSNIHYALSSEAAANVGYESNGVEDDGDLTVDDLPIDEINNVDTSDIPQQSDEELNDIRSAQEQLREKMNQD